MFESDARNLTFCTTLILKILYEDKSAIVHLSKRSVPDDSVSLPSPLDLWGGVGRTRLAGECDVKSWTRPQLFQVVLCWTWKKDSITRHGRG